MHRGRCATPFADVALGLLDQRLNVWLMYACILCMLGDGGEVASLPGLGLLARKEPWRSNGRCHARRRMGPSPRTLEVAPVPHCACVVNYLR